MRLDWLPVRVTTLQNQWSGAGSNRRPADFQVKPGHFRTSLTVAPRAADLENRGWTSPNIGQHAPGRSSTRAGPDHSRRTPRRGVTGRRWCGSARSCRRRAPPRRSLAADQGVEWRRLDSGWRPDATHLIQAEDPAPQRGRAIVSAMPSPRSAPELAGRHTVQQRLADRRRGIGAS